MIFRTILTFLLFLSGAFSVAANNAWVDLGVFTGTNAAAAWRSPTSVVTRPQSGLFAEAAGLTLDCPMQKVVERVIWDADLPLDLSARTEFSLAIRTDDPSAISRCSIYFKSGKGWFGGWFKISGTQWQTVILSRSDFSIEDSPTGWNQIQGVRLAFWKAEDRNTRVQIANIKARANPIVILRNSAAITATPEEKPIIKRAVDRMSLWFSGYGLNASMIDDADLKANGTPPGCRLIILPYNPILPEATRKALQTFTQKGGRLIVVYALTPELAPLLGLSGKQWRKAYPADSFASIRLNPIRGSGLPLAVQQDSWNANIPLVQSAKVLGTWVNGAGVDSGLPAITLGGSGIFIGHVLTNVDRDRKTEMILAMSAMLVPELVPLMAENVIARAGRLFDFSNWPQTKAFIELTAKKHDRAKTTPDNLKAVDVQFTALGKTEKKAAFSDILSSADTLRRRVQEAYFGAVATGKADSELRGVWCHDATGVPGQSWTAVVRQLKHAGLNTLFANHLWGGVAYYPSKVLPTSYRVAAEGDFLQQCLDACRKEGVSLHVWDVLWILDNAPESFIADMKKAGRLQKNSAGKTLEWLCPSHPANRDLAVNAAKEVVQKYAIDGFHMDYIRYPDGNSCYCSGCAERFRKATGRAAAKWPQDVLSGPDKNAYLEWRRNQITITVTRIAKELKAIRPTLQISAAVWAGWPRVRDSIGQDWGAWCRDGILDFVCPMNYVSTAAEAVSLFTNEVSAAGRSVPVYPGIAPSTLNLPPEEVVRQIDELRSAGAKGFILFQLDEDLINTHFPALRNSATAK